MRAPGSILTDLAGTFGFVGDGPCRPGGTCRPTPPMLHEVLVDNERGPFPGAENHGSAGRASHTH